MFKSENNNQNIENVIQKLIKLNFTNEMISKILKIEVKHKKCDLDKFLNIVNRLLDLGYSPYNIERLHRKISGFTHYENNILDEKIDFIKKYKLNKKVNILTLRLSMEAISVRYNYFLSTGYINNENYMEYFHIDKVRFEKFFGINLEQLVQIHKQLDKKAQFKIKLMISQGDTNEQIKKIHKNISVIELDKYRKEVGMKDETTRSRMR